MDGRPGGTSIPSSSSSVSPRGGGQVIVTVGDLRSRFFVSLGFQS